MLMNYSMNKVIELGFEQSWNILSEDSQSSIEQYIREISLSQKQEQVIRDYCSISSSIMIYDVELSILHIAYNSATTNTEKKIIWKEYNAITYTLYRYWFEKDKKGKSHFDKYCDRLLEIQSEERIALNNIRKNEKKIVNLFLQLTHLIDEI